MARYTGPKWRKSRRYGADLWGNPKSMRRGYPPGPRPLRRRKISDRGQQLIEKQKAAATPAETIRQIQTCLPPERDKS